MENLNSVYYSRVMWAAGRFFRVILIICLVHLFIAVSLMYAEELPTAGDIIDQRFSRHYYGMHVDWDLSMDFDAPVRSFISNHYLGAGFSYGYGRSFFRPRPRVSAAWLWDRGFALSAGLELPIVEILSPGQLKMVGLYLTGDYGYVFGQDGGGFYRVSPHIRVPLTALTGVVIGATYSSESEWSIFIGRSIGGYPLKNK